MASSKSRFIKFVRPGYDSTRTPLFPVTLFRPRAFSSRLMTMQFLFDLGPNQLLFPPEIAATTLRPDGVFYSQNTKTVILLELTVPLEDRVHTTHDGKKSKCIPLASFCEENGFRVHLIPIEVGCLGYCPHSLLQSLETIGLPRSTARHIRTECSCDALRCSYLLFLRREIREWNTLQVLY